MAINAYDRVQYAKQEALPTMEEFAFAPLRLTEEHQQIEEQFHHTMSEAQKAELAAMQDPNSKAAQRYQGYTNQLSNAVDDLAAKGVRGTGMRAKLGKIKSDYNKEISPILGAWEQQKADIAAWNEMSAKDRTMMWANDPTKRTIDSYIERGNASYLPEGISGNELTRQVAMAAKPFADWIQQTKPQLAKSGVPFEYFTMVQKGMDPNIVAAAMRKDGFTDAEAAQGAAMLRDLRDQVLTSNGVYELFGNDPQNLQRSIEYANQGLYHAIGTKQFGNLGDDYNKSLALMRAKQKMAGEQTQSLPPTVPLGNITLDDDHRKAIKKTINVLKGSGLKGEITPENLKETIKQNYELYKSPKFTDYSQWAVPPQEALKDMGKGALSVILQGPHSPIFDTRPLDIRDKLMPKNFLNGAPAEDQARSTKDWKPMSYEEYERDVLERLSQQTGLPFPTDNIEDFVQDFNTTEKEGVFYQKGYEINHKVNPQGHDYLADRAMKLAGSGSIRDVNGKKLTQNNLQDSKGNFDHNKYYFQVQPDKAGNPEQIILFENAERGKKRKYYRLPIGQVDMSLVDPLKAANTALSTPQEEVDQLAMQYYENAGGTSLSDQEFYQKTGMTKEIYWQLAQSQAAYDNSEDAQNAVAGFTALTERKTKANEYKYD